MPVMVRGVWRDPECQALFVALARDVDEVGVEFIAANEPAQRAYERLGYRPFLVTYMRRLQESP